MKRIGRLRQLNEPSKFTLPLSHLMNKKHIQQYKNVLLADVLASFCYRKSSVIALKGFRVSLYVSLVNATTIF